MLKIAERADVGPGTVYHDFKSNDDLAIAVLEELIHKLALKMEQVANTFDDVAQVNIRTVIDTVTGDLR